MRSKLPRRGENSADCAKRNQASESILELKIRRKKAGKLAAYSTYVRVSPQKQSSGKTARIEKNFPHVKTQKKTVETATRFDVSLLEIKIRRKKAGEARSVLDIRKSFPAKNKATAKPQE